MDMDYLSDPIFADFGRSDFIGGIDNEALDFGPLEPFDNIDESTNNNSRSSCDNTTLVCDTKTEAPTTPPSSTATDANTNIAIATVSARVSLSSAPIATPLPATAAIINIQATPHLPESPPDSGSEPPYSPLQDVHGLTLTSRDIYNGLPAIHHQPVPPASLHGIHHHMQPQFTPPHQSQHSTHFSHNLHTTHLNTSQHGIGMQDNPNASVIRVKHEAGLIMNASNLSQHMTNHNQPLNSHHNPNDAHIEIPTIPLMYPANGHSNNLMNSHHYDGVSGGSLYPAAASYPNVAGVGIVEPTAPTCILSSMNDVARGTQLVGTPQSNHALLVRTSAPSTPVHQATSRKRKLSTQLDFSEYQIKPDPGLTPLSPVGASISPMAAAESHQHLGPTSPVSINLPAHHQDITSTTPAHSAASLSPALSTVNSNPDTSMDGNAAGGLNGENGDPNALTPCITFSPFQPQNWHKLCDQSLQELPVGYYRVDADKGFNFSVSDDAYVCQKKNHFQITCHARLQGDAKFVKTPSGLEKIKYFRLHFYGVKLEAPNQTIRVEQSQSDRSKRPFHPVPIDLQSHIVSKITVCRLHFSETTNNNMRKKGRPNPEQRYFQLVVGLHVYTMSGNFPVISQGSERIIVRASNPGQFESDVELCWQRGLTQDSIFHMGRVGINCDRPDESLVVHGNIKVSGHIVQPSDSRAKHEIGELDTSVQLRNLLKIRIVRYRYEPEFALHSGLRRNSDSEAEDIVDTGVIAQEVREVIPDAVKEGGSIVLPNGNVIENFLLVNKDRILMENIGAVKELCKVTGSLENRIEHLESVNNRLIREKNLKGAGGFRGCGGKSGSMRDGYEMCSNRSLQIIIFFLVIVMAACLAAVSTLYFIEHNKQDHHSKNVEFLQALMHPNYTHSSHNGHANIHGLYKMNDHLILPFGTSSSRPHGRNSSKPRLELLQYNDNGRSDETSAVMEKPVITLHQQVRTESKFTTSAPLQRNNKTSNSKNKLKWPSVEALNRNIATVASAALAAHAQQQHHENDSNFNIAPPLDIVPELETEESLNASETSSEKVADSIPQHDIDNNSIDSDAQHVIKKAAPNKASSSDAAAAKHKSDKNGDPDIQLQLTTDNTELNSANGQNGNALVYKTVSPPTSTLALTTNKIAADSVNNSVDNSLSNRVGRRSPPQSQQRSVEWVTERTVHVATFGRPAQCTQKLLHDSVSNCQSVCFEESNQLPPIHQPKPPAEQVGNTQINENHQQNVDTQYVDTEDADDADALELDEGHSNLEIHSVNSSTNSSRIAIGKTSHATQANAKQLPFEQQSEDIDNLEPLPKHSLSEEHFGDKAIAFASIEVQHPPVSDCWQISSCIRAGSSLNRTLEAERFCPSSGKSLNITYVIPLSRFFKAPTIELRLSSSLHLEWTICNSQEYTKRNGATLVSSPVHHHHQQEQQPSSVNNQRQPNTSIYFLNIPSRGYFASDIALRATTDSERQNICEESAHEGNTLLQYNFRIVRDCDK